jgi:hypothetical protein
MPPEVLLPRGRVRLDVAKWDVYALGCLIYYLWYKHEPFEHMNNSEVIVAVGVDHLLLPFHLKPVPPKSLQNVVE